MKKLKKLLLKYQDGRSMVEMLGVLAIIGVLSIGALAGFNMAMLRYRTNELLNTIDKLAVLAEQTYNSSKGEINHVDYAEVFGKSPSEGLPGVIAGEDWMYVRYDAERSQTGSGCYVVYFVSVTNEKICNMAEQIAGANKLKVLDCGTNREVFMDYGDCNN